MIALIKLILANGGKLVWLWELLGDKKKTEIIKERIISLDIIKLLGDKKNLSAEDLKAIIEKMKELVEIDTNTIEEKTTKQVEQLMKGKMKEVPVEKVIPILQGHKLRFIDKLEVRESKK